MSDEDTHTHTWLLMGTLVALHSSKQYLFVSLLIWLPKVTMTLNFYERYVFLLLPVAAMLHNHICVNNRNVNWLKHWLDLNTISWPRYCEDILTHYCGKWKHWIDAGSIKIGWSFFFHHLTPRVSCLKVWKSVVRSNSK